jgi:tetratricopeptide (TPR) repeat protein
LGEQEVSLNAQQEGTSDPKAAARAELPPNEQELLQRFDDTEKLLVRGAPDAALKRLGDQEPELSPIHRARWNWLYGWSLVQLRQDQEARAALEQGLEAARASQDICAEGHLHFTLANAGFHQGEYVGVDHAFQEAIRCFKHLNDGYHLACVHDQYGAFLAAQGRFQEAYEQMQHAHSASGRIGSDR